MDDLAAGAPQPHDPRGPRGPERRAAPIIHTREERRGAPAGGFRRTHTPNPLGPRTKLVLGLLTVGIGSGGVLWTAATTFPDVRDELTAQTALRCTASTQCVPAGNGRCWNKAAVAARAVLRWENPLAATRPGAASTCACSQNTCRREVRPRANPGGPVPPPNGRFSPAR